MSKPDRTAAFAACPDTGCDWGSFWQGWIAACKALAAADEWIPVEEALPDVASRLDDECLLPGGEAIPPLNVSVKVQRLSERGVVTSGSIEWFDGQLPHGEHTHWKKLPSGVVG